MKTVSSVVATVFRTIENPIDQNLFPKLGEAQFAFDQIGHTTIRPLLFGNAQRSAGPYAS
jgi:hypothetical protein